MSKAGGPPQRSQSATISLQHQSSSTVSRLGPSWACSYDQNQINAGLLLGRPSPKFVRPHKSAC